MTDTELDELRRATTAVRTGLRAQAGRPAFRPLDVTTLLASTPPRGPRAGRWISAAVGVAAVACGIALLVPSMLGNRLIPAAPVPTPSTTHPTVAPAAGWQPIARPPLSPRRDAVTVWAGDSYLIIGGFDVRPCAVDEDRQSCPEAVPLQDGARFDPATGTWRRIAEAPKGVRGLGGSTYLASAIVGGSVYLRGYEGGVAAMLAYHVDADSWESLPLPEELGTWWAVGSVLVNAHGFETGEVRYDTYDPASRTWTTHTPGVTTPEGSEVAASAIGNNLAIIAAASDPGTDDTLWVALIDVTTGEVGVHDRTPVPNQRPSPVVVGGRVLAWPRGGLTAEDDPDPANQKAWFYDPQVGLWSSVQLPESSSGLTGWNSGMTRDWYVTTDTMVALRGQLYDPRTGTWTRVPDLPVPAHDPLVIGGTDSVLVCYGYDTEAAVFADVCYVLPLSVATGPVPPSAEPSPDLPTPTPSAGETESVPPSAEPSPDLPTPTHVLPTEGKR